MASEKEILRNELRFNPGEIIFLEGDRAESFYYIKSGKVTIYKKNDNGEIINLNEF